MSKPFDMELFLVGALSGSHATRLRHIRQARVIQRAIAERWQKDNPWTWQHKHLVWFLNHHLNRHAESTRYYFVLTVRLLTKRLGKSWQFSHEMSSGGRSSSFPPSHHLVGERSRA
ncbi:hypothetical protein [Pseudomonas sp. H26/SER47-MNA-CIBAN-0231]|uniref:hypothetical protein n=1 Tax=Pseudomonas sp. H26/SER47-MNA-CIBAN-0231 TaxID=3140477 RepID=UPI0009B8F8D8